MAKPKLFEIKQKITQDQMMDAIVAAETERWEKAEKIRSPNQPPAPRDDPKALAARFGKMKPTEAMLAYATSGKVKAIPDAGFVFSKEEAKTIGAVMLEVEKGNEKQGKIHPDVMVVGADKKEYKLEPKELSGWLQARAEEEEPLTIDQWVHEHNIGLNGHGSTLKNGKEELYFEIHADQRRVVGNGKVSEPMDGYYGGIKGTKVGADGDLLDVYVSRDAYADMKAGNSYKGPVFVMQQMNKGKPEEMKLGFAADVDEFRAIMTSTWENANDFREQNEGRYVELNSDQYAQLKKALAKNPNLTLEKFVEDAGLNMDDVERKPVLEEAGDKRAMDAGRKAVGGMGDMVGAEEMDGDVPPPPPPRSSPSQGGRPQGGPQGGARRPMTSRR